MSVVTIWSSATVLPLRLQLAPTSAASNLELLVLEAIQGGVDDAASLAAYFGIPARLMIDLIGDLWRAQRATATLGEEIERIAITDAGREAVRAAAEADYESVMRIPHVEQVLFDSLSGQFVALERSRPRPGDRRLLVPSQTDDPDFRRVQPHHLAEAVARTLRKRGDSDDRIGEYRVVSAHLVPAITAGAEHVRFVPLNVHVSRRNDGGLALRLIESVWPVEVQLQTLERLHRLVSESSGSGFVQALAGSAGERLDEAPKLSWQVAQLKDRAENLAATRTSGRQAAHDQVIGRFETLGHQIADLARREVSVRIVHSRTDHDRTLDTVIETAQQQLILALPWIHYQELNRHYDALASAVGKGVGITVLWGINREEKTLDRPVLALFDDLDRAARAAGRGGFVHLDREQSSHIHAKVVAADDRMALITSRNLFSQSDLFEIGVLIEGPSTARAPLVEQIATWAYNTTPNFGHATHILRDPALFGQRTDGERWSTPSKPTVDLAQLTSPDCPPEHLQLWQKGWLEAISALSMDIVRPAPVGYLVTDGLHQSLLSTALDEAERRVVVSSRGLSSRVLNGGLIEQVRQCLNRGVNVALYYGKADKDEDQRALTRLQEDCAGSAGQLEVTHRPNLHAKVLVFDDELVVGSYNYLNFDAAYGVGRWSQRAEVSVRLLDQTLAETVVKLLSTTHFRGGAKTANVPTPKRKTGPALLTGRVFNALEGTIDPAAMATLVPDPETYVLLNRELSSVGVSLEVARRVDAALVSAGDGPVRDLAVRGLLQRSWRLGDTVVAHTIRDRLGDDDLRPRKALVSVCAAIMHDPDRAEPLVEELLLDDATEPNERHAAVILRMLSILSAGDTGRANSGLVSGLGTLPELDKWHQSALDYVVVHGALPRHLGSLLSTPDGTEQRIWASIPPLIDRLAKWKPGHLESEQTAQYLVTGPLAQLRKIAVSHDDQALITWVAENRGMVDGGWLDDQVQKAGVRIRIDSSRRRYLLAVTRELLLTARKLVALPDPEDSQNLDSLDVDELRELVHQARALLAALPDVIDVGPARSGLGTTFDLDRTTP